MRFWRNKYKMHINFYSTVIWFRDNNILRISLEGTVIVFIPIAAQALYFLEGLIQDSVFFNIFQNELYLMTVFDEKVSFGDVIFHCIKYNCHWYSQLGQLFITRLRKNGWCGFLCLNIEQNGCYRPSPMFYFVIVLRKHDLQNRKSTDLRVGMLVCPNVHVQEG